MSGVVMGFSIIAVIIGAGYIVGRLGLLGPDARPVMARLVFFLLAPCLLFTVIADAEMSTIFSPLLVVTSVAALVGFIAYILVARLVWRRSVADTTIGALCSGYVNANNIGLPVAAYVLGDAAYVAPVILVQLLVFTPIALTALDLSTTGAVTTRDVVLQPVRNPMIIASVLGLIVAALPFTMPAPVMEPFRIIGGGAVPLLLISFGLSLVGQRILEPGNDRRDVVFASVLKIFVVPFTSYLLGRFVFGLTGHDLFVVVTLAALPVAQNVFNYAQRYERGETIARDAVAVTTVGALPVLMVIAAVLH